MSVTPSTTGDDLIVGEAGVENTLAGNSGNDTLVGRGKDDVLLGNTGDDSLSGANGDDTMFGGQGTDTLLGGNGADVLSGDMGADLLIGGNGDDTFVFKAQLSDETTDTIEDFGNADDSILLDLDEGDSYSVVQDGTDVLITLLDASTGLSQYVVVVGADEAAVTAALLIA